MWPSACFGGGGAKAGKFAFNWGYRIGQIVTLGLGMWSGRTARLATYKSP